jgi:4-hydroxy-2-oxoheptanedioate aldolase
MPTGMRSAGPVRALQHHGPDYFAKADGEVVVFAMIETQDGLKNLDAIGSTPGLDALYIGPADLSYALGLPPKADNTDPLHLETCNKILAAAHRNGKKAVMHCASAAFAAGAIERGFDMVMLTSDFHSLIAGAKKQLEDLKGALAGKAVASKPVSSSGY